MRSRGGQNLRRKVFILSDLRQVSDTLKNHANYIRMIDMNFGNVLCISSFDCFFMQCRIIIVQLTLSVRHSLFENQLTKGKMDLSRH